MWSAGFVQTSPALPRRSADDALTLAPGAVRSVDVQPGRPVELSVLAGEVWVTQENDRVDHIVRAGEQLAFAPAGRIVIQANESSVVRIDGPATSRPHAA